MNNTIFLAVRKEGEMLMVGQKGQAAFTDRTTLGRSIGYAYQHESRKKGVKTTDLYSVHEVEVSMLLPKEGEL